jgi:ATP-dependent DNA helicase RecQ
MDLISTYNSFKMLEREGYLELTEEIKNPSKVHFLAERDELYRFQVANKAFDGFIKLLLRAYTGLFTEFVSINEAFLARKANLSEVSVKKYLEKLNALKIIQYIPHKKSPFIIFTEERLDIRNLKISHENFIKRKEGFVLRQDKIWEYANLKAKCRSQYLLQYFGDKDASRCGQCDVCTRRNELDLSEYEFDLILDQVKETLKKEAMDIKVVVSGTEFPEDKVLKVIRFLIDNNKIKYTDDRNIIWTKPFQK